jgi:uncharacterized phiE125 gp8 family phage protein
MAELIAFLSADPVMAEPITIEDVKTQARIDPDLTDDDLFIQSVIIPGARQQAESRTGSAIRPARYRQVSGSFPHHGAAFAITHGSVIGVESITYGLPRHPGLRASLDPGSFEMIVIDKEAVVSPLNGKWPQTGRSPRAVEVTYIAGIEGPEFSVRYPSVQIWILMAAAWAYAQREMFLLQTRGAGYQELPSDYMQALLDPLRLPPRW